MKIEQLLVQHLFNTKQVKLQGIGMLKIKSGTEINPETDKDEPTFSFEYNLKTTEDESLVNYIVQETRKIKPLASSDLESYTILAQQFLNLGKHFYIEGIGTIQKNQLGHFEFIPGLFMSPKIGDPAKQSKDKNDEQLADLETESLNTNKSRNLIIGLSVLGVVLIGFVLFYFISSKNNNSLIQPVLNASAKVKNDSANNNKLNNTDSIDVNGKIVPRQTNSADNGSFKIVLKEYPTLKAVEIAYAKLTDFGHKVKIVKIDSVKFKLIMSFIRPLKDSSKVKDSLKQFFGGKPYIEHI